MRYIFALICIFFCASSAFAYSSGYGSAASAARSYYSSHSYYNSAGRAGSGYYNSYSNYNSSVPSINSTYTRTRSGYSGNYVYRPASSTPSSYAATAARIKHTSNNAGVSVVPFRYNTLNYTRVRNMEADPPKKYSAKCTDIGDASFCQ